MIAPAGTTIDVIRPELVSEQLIEVCNRLGRKKHLNEPPTHTDTLMLLPNYAVQERQANELYWIRCELNAGNVLLRELIDTIKARASDKA
ncbi:MAG: hypothetical protein V5B36_14045 [Candidatus Accumulibacter sp. UW25]|jgi:hypothetical protein